MRLVLVLIACLAASLTYVAHLSYRDDGLTPVPTMDYTNDYPDYGIRIRCEHRGTRSDFKQDGSDIAAGDRIIRDCRVTSR